MSAEPLAGQDEADFLLDERQAWTGNTNSRKTPSPPRGRSRLNMTSRLRNPIRSRCAGRCRRAPVEALQHEMSVHLHVVMASAFVFASCVVHGFADLETLAVARASSLFLTTKAHSR